MEPGPPIARLNVHMRNISTATPPVTRPIDLIPQIVAAIIGGFIIFSVLIVAV
jgi:hypothetical protein